MIHTDFKRNTKLFLIFKSGEKLVCKYKESKSGVIITFDHGKIKTKDLRSVTIAR